ncbi:hypothetical protein SISNIDRAFT_480701 [Sistotremastrum niveocremeum HHB9708]|uniref:Fe2OG dioxygenase domain-containing protein n=1 Tax=Sistotremastrum niveocremeum HHB9708 TaxID=1314777 RepID=A0A165AJV4_9AGAM|nr:hypothetical protein SISNIDRAFT_480701 [Sistotremastrum niveocremeum HHB9708]
MLARTRTLARTLLHARSCCIQKKSLTGYPPHLVDAHGDVPAGDFCLIENFLSKEEQFLLLTAALRKLDANETVTYRKRRKTAQVTHDPSSENLLSAFHSDEFYRFENGHYDGVIRHYREMHVTAWPLVTDIESQDITLDGILRKLLNFFPVDPVQTHILHLASEGEILPHVDNTSASGTYILGVSLGATRMMRVESVDSGHGSFDVLLPSGSVYVQKDLVRYGYRHAILKNGTFKGIPVAGGPRLSVMMRDMLSTNITDNRSSLRPDR